MHPLELPIPVEIPWKLAATTQQLAGSGPQDTTISLFTTNEALRCGLARVVARRG